MGKMGWLQKRRDGRQRRTHAVGFTKFRGQALDGVGGDVESVKALEAEEGGRKGGQVVVAHVEGPEMRDRRRQAVGQ